MLIPVSAEPRSHLVFQLQANNLSGVWKYMSWVCDSAWNQDFQECLLEETLLCASHFLMLTLNVNSKQLQETQFPLEIATSIFPSLQSHMHIHLMKLKEFLGGSVFWRMLSITQTSCMKSLPHNWGGDISGAVLGSNANSYLLVRWPSTNLLTFLSFAFLICKTKMKVVLVSISSSGPRYMDAKP